MATSLQVRPVVLEGECCRLEPLSSEHAGPLAGAVDERTFEHFSAGYAGVGTPAAQAAAYVASRTTDPAGLGFAVVERASGRVVGATCYLDIRPMHRGLEIGATFYAREVRRTRVNPECKYLLLRHAFERLGCVRVQLKTDARNLVSQGAIVKLGAVREGVLRKQLLMPSGRFRDTVMFSISDDEWPAVRARLEARLGYAPPP